MSSHYKALLVVMCITVLVFLLVKPVFCKFMEEADFVRRRNIWLVLTLAAFVVPVFWLYLALASVVIAYGGAKDNNAAALYTFLLFALPPLAFQLPAFGIVNQIFAIDHYRLLSLVLLAPVALRLFRSAANPVAKRISEHSNNTATRSVDVLLVSYAVLQVLLMFPNESVTSSIRRVFLLFTDVLLPYFVLSRVCINKEMIADAMASFVLSMVVLAPLAAVEFGRSWLLYGGVEAQWGTTGLMAYLTRGAFLRAQVTAGHSIMLGNAMIVAIGFWLSLRTRETPTASQWIVLLVLLAGLIAPLSKGPWLGAGVLVLSYLALGPNATSRTLKGVSVLIVSVVAVLASPWQSTIVDYLPFVGTVDEGSVTYRQQLAAVSWALIKQNPFFGSNYFLAYMEELRQGQGIIDLVNGYATIALTYGLVGLGLFAGFFVTIVVKCIAVVRRTAVEEHNLSLIGASLVASLIGVMVVFATVSNWLSIPFVYLSLAGLAAAYMRVAGAQTADRR